MAARLHRLRPSFLVHLLASAISGRPSRSTSLPPHIDRCSLLPPWLEASLFRGYINFLAGCSSPSHPPPPPTMARHLCRLHLTAVASRRRKKADATPICWSPSLLKQKKAPVTAILITGSSKRPTMHLPIMQLPSLICSKKIHGVPAKQRTLVAIHCETKWTLSPAKSQKLRW